MVLLLACDSRARALQVPGVARGLGADVVLGERFLDSGFRHRALHEAAPQRLPAAGPARLLIEIALAFEGAEQPGRDVHRPGCQRLCHRGAQIVVPGVDRPLAGAAGGLVPLDVDSVLLEVDGGAPAQQVASRHAARVRAMIRSAFCCITCLLKAYIFAGRRRYGVHDQIL
ncbi:hypothetical protein [Cupriavidus necator]